MRRSRDRDGKLEAPRRLVSQDASPGIAEPAPRHLLRGRKYKAWISRELERLQLQLSPPGTPRPWPMVACCCHGLMESMCRKRTGTLSSRTHSWMLEIWARSVRDFVALQLVVQCRSVDAQRD